MKNSSKNFTKIQIKSDPERKLRRCSGCKVIKNDVAPCIIACALTIMIYRCVSLVSYS